MHNDSELLKLVRLSAAHFLDVADRLNEEVSAYMNGSHEAAYHMVKDANSIFIQLYNMYFHENRVPSLDYELAESLVL